MLGGRGQERPGDFPRGSVGACQHRWPSHQQRGGEHKRAEFGTTDTKLRTLGGWKVKKNSEHKGIEPLRSSEAKDKGGVWAEGHGR